MDYYAVFDGHGGQDAAAYCATHLHQYLVESVHYPTDPERALRDAFLTTDAQFLAKSSTQVNVSYVKCDILFRITPRYNNSTDSSFYYRN